MFTICIIPFLLKCGFVGPPCSFSIAWFLLLGNFITASRVMFLFVYWTLRSVSELYLILT
jgi:hypothetical protein